MFLLLLGIVFILSTFIVLMHQSLVLLEWIAIGGKIHEGSVPVLVAPPFLGCLIGLGFWDEKVRSITSAIARVQVFVAGLAEDLTGHVALCSGLSLQ